jgi:hypothetical protein
MTNERAAPPGDRSQLDWLTEINTDDMLEALGLAQQWRGRRALRWLCRAPARALARQVIAYDDYVGAHGLAAGAGWIVRRHVRRVEAAGVEGVPRDGPLLIVANHPGLTDTMALFASLPRADLRIVAADRPFLRALPNTSRHLIYLPDGAGERLGVVRAVASHLRRGGAALTFPGGEIEPDPAVLPDASAALARWSESVGLFARALPELRVMPAIVSGVLSAAAQRHPLTRLRRARADRERFGAMLQILVPAYRAVDVRVAFGPPLRAADLAAGADARAITQAIIVEARRLIDHPPSEWRPIVSARD